MLFLRVYLWFKYILLDGGEYYFNARCRHLLQLMNSVCSRRAFDFKKNSRLLFAFESISIQLIVKYISSWELFLSTRISEMSNKVIKCPKNIGLFVWRTFHAGVKRLWRHYLWTDRFEIARARKFSAKFAENYWIFQWSYLHTRKEKAHKALECVIVISLLDIR